MSAGARDPRGRAATLDRMPSRRIRAAATSAFLAACVVALPATAEARVIGTAKAKGRHASALVSAASQNPSRLYVRISSSPRQRVSVSWHAICWRGDASGSKSGTFKARTTVKRKIRMPKRNPDRCTLSANGRLAGSGRITVQLVAS